MHRRAGTYITAKSMDPGSAAHHAANAARCAASGAPRKLRAPTESCTLSTMEWTDEGIVLGVRRHGESSAIAELLTRGHGRHLGLVRGGSSKRLRPMLQPGNSVTAVWRARLDEHLGYYVLEGTRLRAATVLASSHATYGVTHLASLARLLPERDPHEDIYEMLERTLDDFDDIGEAAIHLVKFELAMLAELGFGLDLETCAATGGTSDLIYVSPKSGGAVSRQAGDPWRDRLLRLPPFLRAGGGPNGWSDQDLQDGFRLTGLFLLRHVLEPRGQGHSDARDGFINAVTRHRARISSAV